MKSILKWGVVGVLVAGCAAAFADETPRSPNIMMIVSDDQGYGDFGFTGNKIVKTPTRSSLLTGREHA